jgi:hypothetical protein
VAKFLQCIGVFLVVDEIELKLGVELAGVTGNVFLPDGDLDPVRKQPFPDLQ